MERKIRMRKECPEISWGDWKIVHTSAADVLVMRYDWHAHSLLILHNFSDEPRAIRLDIETAGNRTLVDLLATHDSRADADGRHQIQLEPVCVPVVPRARARPKCPETIKARNSLELGPRRPWQGLGVAGR